ncbi:hypothetical protein GOODEAATRI_011416 [Goodea atripinnis]|uniref:C2 domain-containing protein n=1 Tax=Goodea atripinnis TaxID=208336 RepID=A0ABV0NTQ7_9TELE
MSTRLMRLRQSNAGSGPVKERDMEDAIQELEARVGMLESQKEVLQNKLSLAKQHILDLGTRTPYRYNKGKNLEGEAGVRRAARTAPARYGLTLEETRAEMERLTTIRENVDLIRLQKQLSEKSAALRVTQEKIVDLQEGALLEKVEELTEQLKQERQKALTLEGQLTTTTLSLQTLDKAFRMQQESREGLGFLVPDGGVDDSSRELVNIQASHAETVLELQKTRNLLLLEHKITKDLQLRELAYSPRNYKRTIPIQYTWPAGDQEVAATFTPVGLRIMSSLHPGVGQHEHIVTFCTYCLLDFEMHSTPLVSGSQPNYGFTSRYALTVRDLGRLDGQGSRVQLELHQALGGVRFITHGSGSMSLMGAMERRGERICSSVSITGNEGETIGVVDFWVRLFPPAEPINTAAEIRPDRRTVTQRSPVQIPLGWQDSGQEELHDYGGGIPNELVVMLERCVGLNARWPGLLPDAYLTYRLYDLPPHVSPMVQCSIDPVFNDVTSFPLAVTTDVLHYLRSSSLWVYVFDDSDEQIPPAYLAKTPIPLRALATGREIRGEAVRKTK